MSKTRVPKKVVIDSLARLVTYDAYKRRFQDESIRDEALEFYHSQLEHFKTMHHSTRIMEYTDSYLPRKKELEKEIETFFYFINKEMLPIVDIIKIGFLSASQESISRGDASREFMKK